MSTEGATTRIPSTTITGMRGDDRQPTSMFSYVSAEDRVPADHPLRPIRALVDEILRDMSRDFDGLYARVGRPSIPPERLLRAQLLQLFYSIRSERLLMEAWASHKSFQPKDGPPDGEGATSTARPAPTTRTRRRPIRMRACIGNRGRPRRAWRTSGTC